MLREHAAGEHTPKEEIAARIAGLKALMAKSGIDFCVIMQHVDLFYFTGSTQKATLVVPLEGEPLYFVAEERRTRAGGDAPCSHRNEERQGYGECAQGERVSSRGRAAWSSTSSL